MNILAWDQVNDIAINPERLPIDGEWCCITDGKRITKKQYHPPIEATERELEEDWVDSKVKGLSKKLLSQDVDNTGELFAYIRELRLYLINGDFTNRPKLK